MSENLWPDFDIGKAPRSPKTVIEEAGGGLSDKTKGIIRFYTMSTKINENDVNMSFSLYSISLSYHFPFLRARFAVDSLYPVTIVADKMSEVVANNENELTALLAKIFKASVLSKIFETVRYSRQEKGTALPAAEFLTIAILKEFYSQGIAQKIFQNFLSEMQKRGIKQFKVIVGENLPRAIRFYEKTGFKFHSNINIHQNNLSRVYIYTINNKK